VVRVAFGALMAIALALCTGFGGVVHAFRTTDPVTSTDKTVRPGLLRPADLDGFGTVKSVPLNKAKLFEDPDPRGPCGVKITPPRLSKGATRVFQAPGGVIIDTVVRVSEQRARALMDAMEHDAIAACPAYTSTTNTGAEQTVMPTLVDLPMVGDQRVGGTAAITVGGQTGYAGTVRIRRGRYLDFAVAFSGIPVRPDVVRVLAERMDGALRRLSGSSEEATTRFAEAGQGLG
jgi:hypothetical protein